MSSTERRRALTFGAGALVVLGLFAWGLHRKHHLLASELVGGIGAATFLCSLVSPALTLRIRAAWMAFAHALGYVNSRILLSVIFFVVVTPIAVALRLLRRRPIDLAWRSVDASASYWFRRPPDGGCDYEKLF